ncbi:MAG: tRNA lysidine(34) synthetase TilS [Bacilli bacterium]|nr:tRNA lysidine(34) synthetase TilS [Bacilli bacterium]
MKEVTEFLDKYLNNNDIVVCATSGGVDSMSLLNILINYKKNIKIICAHVNHNLRDESNEEYEFVKEYCKDNNIIFEGTILGKNIKGNLEAEFRKKRYTFFEDIIKKYGAKYLFTAHHGDDLVETILMRIVRGSSIEGYSGFDKVTDKGFYKILRPMIFLTKDEIYKYVKENGIEYREDKTNESDKYTRNRYRKYILPKLKEENHNVHKKFLKYSEEISESYKFIHNFVKDIIRTSFSDNNLKLNDIKKMDDFIVKKVLYDITKDIYADNLHLLTEKNIDGIVKIIKSNRPNLEIDLPMNKKAIKKYDTLVIKDKNTFNDYIYEIKNEDIKLELGTIKKVDSTTLTSNYVCHLNSNDIKLPLYVRNRKYGDYIEVLGMNGKKKIKDIFIDEKINKEIRDKYPVVVDSDDNIIWIPGIKKSKYNSLNSKKYDIILWYTKEEKDE